MRSGIIATSYIRSTYSQMAQNYIDYLDDNSLPITFDEMSLHRLCINAKPFFIRDDLYYLLGEDAGASCVNLVNPGVYTATPYGGLTWSADGVKGNGSNAYLNTNFNPSLLVSGQKYQTTDASRGAVISVDPAPLSENKAIDGITTASYSANSLYTQNVGRGDESKINRGNNAGVFTGIDVSGTGFISISKLNNNERLTKKDQEYSAVSSFNTISSAYQVILRSRNDYGFSPLGLSCYFMGASMPYGIIQQFRRAYNQFLVTNGLTPIA